MYLVGARSPSNLGRFRLGDDLIDLTQIDPGTGLPSNVPINPVTGCPVGVVGCKPIVPIATTGSQLPGTLTPSAGDSLFQPLDVASLFTQAYASQPRAAVLPQKSWFDQAPLGVANKWLFLSGGGLILFLLLGRR